MAKLNFGISTENTYMGRGIGPSRDLDLRRHPQAHPPASAVRLTATETYQKCSLQEMQMQDQEGIMLIERKGARYWYPGSRR